MKTLRKSFVITATASIQWFNVRGHPVSVFFGLPERLAADLIVIGKHGSTVIEERLLGSIPQNGLPVATCCWYRD